MCIGKRGGEDCFALFTSTRGGFLRSEGERRGDADTRNGKKDLNSEKIEEEKEQKAHSHTWAQGVQKWTIEWFPSSLSVPTYGRFGGTHLFPSFSALVMT